MDNRRKCINQRSPFEMIYGKAPRMVQKEIEAINGESKGLEVEILASENRFAIRPRRGNQNKESSEKSWIFAVMTRVFVVIHGESLQQKFYWSALRTKYCNSRIMTKARQERYEIFSNSRKRSRSAINARHLIPYHNRPEYLFIFGT